VLLTVSLVEIDFLRGYQCFDVCLVLVENKRSRYSEEIVTAAFQELSNLLLQGRLQRLRFLYHVDCICKIFNWNWDVTSRRGKLCPPGSALWLRQQRAL